MPSLARVADRRVRAGRSVRVRVLGRAGSADHIALEATWGDGAPLAALGAWFVDRGRGRGELRWRPGSEHVGTHTVRFSGRTSGRLETHRTIEIEVRAVEDRPRVSRRSFWAWLGWLLGQRFVR